MIVYNGFEIKKLPGLQFLHDFFKAEEEQDIDITVIGEFDNDCRLVIRELYLDNNEMTSKYIKEKVNHMIGIKPDFGFLITEGCLF